MADAKRRGVDCQADACTQTVSDGPLYRVSPKGQPGVFMCAEHAHFVDAWEQRIDG